MLAYEAAVKHAASIGESMGAIDPLKVLQNVSFSQYLNGPKGGQELYAFAKMLKRKTVRAGEVFFSEGDEADDGELFIVETGTIEAVIEGVGVVHNYKPGEFFGERAVLGVGHGKRSATVRCRGTGNDTASCSVIGREGITPLVGPITLDIARQEQAYKLEVEVFIRLDLDSAGLLEDDESFDDALEVHLMPGEGTDAKTLAQFKADMTDSKGFTVDEFSDWWQAHPSERVMLFAPTIRESVLIRQSLLHS